MLKRFLDKFLGVFRQWWTHRVSLAISLIVTLIALVIYLATFVGERPTPIFGFIDRLELSSLDTRFLLRGTAHPDPRLVVVDIDQRSQEVLGRWPFPRIVFAKTLDALREDGARVAVFDITFSEPDRTAEPLRELWAQLAEQQKAGRPVSPQLLAEIKRQEQLYNYDQRFVEAIQRLGKVVLGNFFLYTQADLQGVSAETLDRYASLLAYFPFPQVRPTSTAHGQQSYANMIQNYRDLGLLPRGAEANIEPLTQALASTQGGTGFFNVFTDPDGVVRRAVLALPYGRDPNRANWDVYASIDVQAIRLYLGLSEEQTILYFGEAGVASIQFGPKLAVHPDDIGRMMINFQGPVRTYKYVSIADVVKRNFPPGTFKDKIVLIGASATGIGDLRVTPYGSLDYPGVEIHANVIDNILNQKFLVRGADQVTVDLVLIFLFGIPLGIWLGLTKPRWIPLGLLVFIPFLWLLHSAFEKGWWLNFTVPSVTLVANTGFVALYRLLVEEREKRKVRGAFQQYLSPEVIRRLLQNPELVQPRKTEISVMFTDVRGFTSISEKLDAQELAMLLNSYLTEMTKIVFNHHGTLDKYIGDAVMAIWGAPFEEPGHPGRACQAGLEMIARLQEMQDEWKAKGLPVLNIGVGINTGVASVGNMGSELRYGYTAMGDAVNLASRLEGLNKEYGTHIIISESTYAVVADKGFILRELDLIRVIGKLQPVKIYELLAASNGASAHVERLELFARGRDCYLRRQWRNAQIVLEELLKRWPDDGPSRAYWKRCQEYLFEEPEPKWDGVFVMTHK